MIHPHWGGLGRRAIFSRLMGWGVVMALASIAGAGATANNANAQVPRSVRPYDISALDLAEALQVFGKVSHAQLLYAPQLVKGHRSRAVKGLYSDEDALALLLEGSGLTAARTGSVILIGPSKKPDPGPFVPAETRGAAVRASDDDDRVETVIVVVGKRPENIQAVSVSVSAATATQIEGNLIRDFDDIARLTPSLTITKTSQPANNSINIRGIGTYSYSIATEPSVAVVIDEIPQAFQAAAFSALVDVQQIEILRGPQNTLFGKSASAGVVNIVTQPASDTFTARADVMVTNDDEQRFQAMVSGPLGARVKFRLAGNFSRFRGNVYNLATGNWLNGQTTATLRGKWVWTPSRDVTVTVSPFATSTLSSCCAGGEAFLSPGVTYSKGNIAQSVILDGITPSPSNRLVRMDVDARADTTDYGAGLKIVRQLDAATLTSISSYESYRLRDMQDTDSSDFDFSQLAPQAPRGGSANGGRFKITSVTQELRLTSPSLGRLKYVAGLFVSRTQSQRYFVRGANDLGTYNGLSAIPSSNSTAYSAYVAHATASNYAAFGQASYDLTKRLGLTAGLRLNREDIRYRFEDIGNAVVYGTPACSSDTPTPKLRISTCNSDTSLTGRAGVTFAFAPEVMGFATYTRGYKGMAYDLTSTLTVRSPIPAGPFQGIAVADAVAAKQPIDPERVNSYELGLRTAWFRHRLVWNLTAFYEGFTGFQAQSRDTATGQNVLNSIGRVTSKGIESEMTARLGPFWSLYANASYDKATMNDFRNANCFGFQTLAEGCVGGVQDLSGKPLFNAPQWSVNAGAAMDAPLRKSSGWRAFANVAVRWQSDVVFNLLQDPDSIQKAYGVTNISAGVHNARWKVTLFVNNLFDKPFALTRGRDTQWNISRTPSPATDAITWKPARDSARYAGIRLTATY